ncbi:MAG TPA: phosphotransferase [Phototrophicaceae bacterium]|nr:phosphotransferase [Phototrophicaceae bacterium]
MSDLLQQIQQLQFSDKSGAEARLLSFVRDIFSPDVTAVELRPLAISLNSFNGFLTLADGRRLFFKTHTEADTIIGEYYNAAMLAEAGYPVIRPIFSSTETGKQFLIYEIIEAPSVFDVAWTIENGQSDALPALTTAQQQADDQLLRHYLDTLAKQTADQMASAPVHQLFSHRLTGGRLARFYAPEQPISLPGLTCTLQTVRQAKWEINGQVYDDTLDTIIQRSIDLLQPAQAGPVIVGHGDAHNGNVFFRHGEPLLYFDPAFAGRHHPLLDLTKPLFHNVLAMWMYFPQEKRQQTRITLDSSGDRWRVSYDYSLHPVRMMFFESKVERVLIPILRELQRRDWLRTDWRAYLKAALFCCPFLTMNLADANKFPPEISLLGFSMAVEMGAESRTHRSLLDRTLDQVAATL